MTYIEVKGSEFVPTQEELKEVFELASRLEAARTKLETKYRGVSIYVDVERLCTVDGKINYIVSDVTYSHQGRLSWKG